MDKTKVNENSISELVVKKWKSMNPQPMSVEDSELFIKLCMIDRLEKNAKWESEVNDQFVIKVITKRLTLNTYQFDLTTPAKLCINIFGKSLGGIMILLALIQSYVKDRGVKDVIIDMEALANIFPAGFPTEDQLTQIWDNQKCYDLNQTGNVIDCGIAYKSIML